jgi:hypothetical protein
VLLDEPRRKPLLSSFVRHLKSPVLISSPTSRRRQQFVGSEKPAANPPQCPPHTHLSVPATASTFSFAPLARVLHEHWQQYARAPRMGSIISRIFDSLGVAVQVESESKGLKPVFHFIGYQGLKPGAFKLWGNCIQRVQPNLG